MTGRAVKEMTRATQLSPELGTAHFQHGLLHMARVGFAQAQAAWEPLDQLEEDGQSLQQEKCAWHPSRS
jgi:hypothetical protein